MEEAQPHGQRSTAAPGPPSAEADVLCCFGYPMAKASDSLLSKNGRWCGTCVHTLPTHDPTSPYRFFKYQKPTEQDAADVLESNDGSCSTLRNMSDVSVDGVSIQEVSPDRAVRTMQTEVVRTNQQHLLPRVHLKEHESLRLLQQPFVDCKLDNTPHISRVAQVGRGQVVLPVQEGKQAPAFPVDGLKQVAT